MFSCKKCEYTTENRFKFAGHMGGHQKLGKTKPVENLSKSTMKKKEKARLKREGLFVDGRTKLLPFETLKGDKARKRYLILERGHQCESCKLLKWLDGEIPIELDHIDGNHMNGEKSNLRLLCPNCHAKTSTYRGKNIGKREVGSTRDKRYRKYGTYR